MPKLKHILIFLLSLTLLSNYLYAEAPPRIALVLGGGGARGAAHIGVLEVLEQEHIPISCVVGTSMGGLTAGAYAAGLSPTDMRHKLDKADWHDIFADYSDYSHLSYRKKHVTKRFLSGTEVNLTPEEIQLQAGVISGEKIKLFFNQLVGSDAGERDIEDLPIPTAIIATDIGTGEKVVMRSGSLTQAMRASMSVPGLMAPVEYNDRKLVDGGLVDNLPVAEARELCHPDIIIAVNVSSPLKPADKVESLVSVTAQMIGILTHQNLAKSEAELGPNDIYIEPKLGNFTAADFDQYRLAADLGNLAAQEKLAQLQKYSVDEASYQAWLQHKQDKRNRNIQINAIAIGPLKYIPPAYIEQNIHQQINAPLDRKTLEQDLIRTYGDGYYDYVDYRIAQDQGKNTLWINVQERKWSDDYFTFGFSMDNEYRQGSRFDLRSAYRSTWLNPYGGEIFATADIGSNPALEAEFYQPLDYRQTYFINPAYHHERETIDVYRDDTQIAEYQLTRAYSELMFGRNLDNYGQIKAGWRTYDMKSTANVSAVELGNLHATYGGYLFEMVMDDRNRLYFPSHGWYGDISYFESNQQDYNKLSSELGFAYPVTDYVIAVRANYTRALRGQLPAYDAAYLGGFLNMSAYATNQVIADNALYAHIRGERIIGRMPLGLNGDLRIGLGLEAAKVEQALTLTQPNQWLNSGVIYLGGETPLGPAYMGLGFSSHGRLNLYLQLGAK